MNEIPTRLAKHPKIFDDPEVALKDTFEEVDRALVDAAAEDEQVYRYYFLLIIMEYYYFFY